MKKLSVVGGRVGDLVKLPDDSTAVIRYFTPGLSGTFTVVKRTKDGFVRRYRTDRLWKIRGAS